MIRTKLARGECERGAYGPGTIHKEPPTLVWLCCLWEAAEPTYTRASATCATRTQPGFAQPHSTLRTTFVSTRWLPAGTHDAAQPAHRQQQHTARAPAARRPDSTRRPAAGPFPTLPPPPLHLNTLRLGPWASPPRLCPRGRNAATSSSKKCPIAAEKASPPDVPSGANRATDSVDLQHSNTEVNTASCAKRAMDKGPGSSAAPVMVAPAAVQWQKPKAVSGASDSARQPAGHRSPTEPTLPPLSPASDTPTNPSRLDPMSLPTTLRPRARCRPTPSPSAGRWCPQVEPSKS